MSSREIITKLPPGYKGVSYFTLILYTKCLSSDEIHDSSEGLGEVGP